MPQEKPPEPRAPLVERSLVRVLGFGFGLVMLLLGVAGALAVLESRGIRRLILESTGQLEEIDRRLALQLGELAWESALLLGACFLLALACAAGTIVYVRRMVRRMEAQAEELSRVSWHMLRTQEEAARRFSHELHDELGQSLAAVKANFERLGSGDPGPVREDGLRLVEEAIANVRELSQLLRPVILDDFGLDAGLRWLAEKFAQRTRIEVVYESSLTCRLHNDLETHLFRIAQEALTNIARHADASRVRVRLDESAGSVILRIEDDGRGLPVPTTPKPRSLGLVGMRARARACGGELELKESAEGGLAVLVTAPLRVAEREGEAPEDEG
jgi:signal transduction histidine kinase